MPLMFIVMHKYNIANDINMTINLILIFMLTNMNRFFFVALMIVSYVNAQIVLKEYPR